MREEIAHSDVKEWVLGTKSTAKARLCLGILANNVPRVLLWIYSLTAAAYGH